MHDIDFSNNRANIAYVGKEPWHGLGSKLESNQPLDVWMREAGLDWTYERAPVEFCVPYVEGHRPFTNRFVLYRSDTRAPLSIVSDRYRVVQPAEIFDFFRDFVTAGDMEIETAGSLRGGEKIWALARLGKDFTIKGADRVQSYVLLITGCDTKLATTGQLTSVRVVCWNTMSYAVQLGQGQSSTIRVPHTLKFDPDRVKGEMGLVQNAWSTYETQAKELANRRLGDNEVAKFLIDLLGDPQKDLKDQPNKPGMSAILSLYTGKGQGSMLESADGTAWGLVNAVTEWVDHHRRARSNDSRLHSAWAGEGNQLKQKAWAKAVELVA